MTSEEVAERQREEGAEIIRNCTRFLELASGPATPGSRENGEIRETSLSVKYGMNKINENGIFLNRFLSEF